MRVLKEEVYNVNMRERERERERDEKATVPLCSLIP